jgi:putative acetyltransferase
MDQAASLHDFLELDVFEANKLGRAFYAKYGFVPINKYQEELTGEMMIRLRYEREKMR